LYFIENAFSDKKLKVTSINDLIKDYGKIHPYDTKDLKLNKSREFALSLIFKIYENKEDIDFNIEKYSKNRRLERIDIITLCILRLGICQFIFFKDIPPKVVINESVALSKLYEEDEKTPSFINGILDKIFHEKITA